MNNWNNILNFGVHIVLFSSSKSKQVSLCLLKFGFFCLILSLIKTSLFSDFWKIFFLLPKIQHCSLFLVFFFSLFLNICKSIHSIDELITLVFDKFGVYLMAPFFIRLPHIIRAPYLFSTEEYLNFISFVTLEFYE